MYYSLQYILQYIQYVTPTEDLANLPGRAMRRVVINSWRAPLVTVPRVQTIRNRCRSDTFKMFKIGF
jgi:hypothetical protein